MADLDKEVKQNTATMAFLTEEVVDVGENDVVRAEQACMAIACLQH